MYVPSAGSELEVTCIQLIPGPKIFTGLEICLIHMAKWGLNNGNDLPYEACLGAWDEETGGLAMVNRSIWLAELTGLPSPSDRHRGPKPNHP